MERDVLILESIASTRNREHFEGPALNFIPTLKPN